ncbi:hypothetical protein ACU4GD_40855 [Cupriavidus basilensis]
MALCAEAGGAMSRMLADTVSTRASAQQFGAPIATAFQVLQHRTAGTSCAARTSRGADQQVAAMQAGADPAQARAEPPAPPRRRPDGRQVRGPGRGADPRWHGRVTEERAVGHYFRARHRHRPAVWPPAEHHLRRYADLLYPAAA